MALPRSELAATLATVRFDKLATLDAAGKAALQQAARRSRRIQRKRELLTENEEIPETLLILSGWAMRIRLLEDGRRQVLGFLLPGDLVGLSYLESAVASTTVVAVTDMDICTAPHPSISPSLARGYETGRMFEETYLLAQITRLGRMNAHERITDLLLELLDRLELAGLALRGRLEIPITQELIADALGLTSVHVNRTLQALRRDGSLEGKGRDFIVSNPDALRQSIGRRTVRVMAA